MATRRDQKVQEIKSDRGRGRGRNVDTELTQIGREVAFSPGNMKNVVAGNIAQPLLDDRSEGESV